jgi:hypothetical protein
MDAICFANKDPLWPMLEPTMKNRYKIISASRNAYVRYLLSLRLLVILISAKKAQSLTPVYFMHKDHDFR